MDKTALESHLVTLMRIVTSLFAMAGFDGKTLPARGERSFPRPLHRAVTTLLRPAESATRRLIICMAASIAIRPRKPQSGDKPIAFFQRQQAARSGHLPSATYAAPSKPPRLPSFPLCDPKMRSHPRKRRRKHGEPAPAIPRIRSFDFDPRLPAFVPAAPPPTPSPAKLTPDPDRPIDAAKLIRRLAVLGHALETMPKQARRFARWRTQRDQDLEKRRVEIETAELENRDVDFDSKRKSPLPLRATPPGGHRRDYKPNAKHRNMREIDEVLYDLNDLAWRAAWPAAWADAWPDTS